MRKFKAAMGLAMCIICPLIMSSATYIGNIYLRIDVDNDTATFYTSYMDYSWEKCGKCYLKKIDVHNYEVTSDSYLYSNDWLKDFHYIMDKEETKDSCEIIINCPILNEQILKLQILRFDGDSISSSTHALTKAYNRIIIPNDNSVIRLKFYPKYDDSILESQNISRAYYEIPETFSISEINTFEIELPNFNNLSISNLYIPEGLMTIYPDSLIWENILFKRIESIEKNEKYPFY